MGKSACISADKGLPRPRKVGFGSRVSAILTKPSDLQKDTQRLPEATQNGPQMRLESTPGANEKKRSETLEKKSTQEALSL